MCGFVLYPALCTTQRRTFYTHEPPVPHGCVGLWVRHGWFVDVECASSVPLLLTLYQKLNGAVGIGAEGPGQTYHIHSSLRTPNNVNTTIP